MRKEASTDLWVYDLLKEVSLNHFSPQGSNIEEIHEALKSASKSGTGNVGFPEYTGVVKDFLIVIENKADLSFHEKRDENELLSEDVKSNVDFAVNGALFYGKHLAQNTSYKKIIAIGVSGNEKRHKITPVFIDERLNYKELPEIETFISFKEDNIDEYYIKEILKESTDYEKETTDIFNFEVAASYLLGSGVGIGLLAIINNYIKINKQKNNLNKSNDNLVLRLKKRANTINK